MCQQSLLDRFSSEDEDDMISLDDEGEHIAWNFFLEVAQDEHGMLVESFLEHEELERTAELSSFDFFFAKRFQWPGSLMTAGRWEMMC